MTVVTIFLLEALPKTSSWAGPGQHSLGTAEPRASAQLRGSTGVPGAFHRDDGASWLFSLCLQHAGCRS